MQIVSRKSQLAVQALVWISGRPNEVHNVGEIAASVGVSVTSLTKVMQALGRAGYVQGERGVGGGYRMGTVSDAVSLYDLAVYLGDYDKLEETCFLGITVCNSEDPCSAHQFWEGHKKEVLAFLRKTSLNSILKGTKAIS